MSTALPVVRARWCDIGRIADLVAEALAPTALAAWLVPDKSRRLPVLAAVARIWTEHALLFGDAFLLPDGSAATVWFHRYRPIPVPTGTPTGSPAPPGRTRTGSAASVRNWRHAVLPSRTTIWRCWPRPGAARRRRCPRRSAGWTR